MLSPGTGLSEGRKESYSLVGVDGAVNRMYYLCSVLSARLSPLGGEREGRSYQRKADNP